MSTPDLQAAAMEEVVEKWVDSHGLTGQIVLSVSDYRDLARRIAEFVRAAADSATEEAAKFVENITWPNTFDSQDAQAEIAYSIRLAIRARAPRREGE